MWADICVHRNRKVCVWCVFDGLQWINVMNIKHYRAQEKKTPCSNRVENTQKLSWMLDLCKLNSSGNVVWQLVRKRWILKINVSKKLLRYTAWCDKYCHLVNSSDSIRISFFFFFNSTIWTLAVNRDTLLRLPHWPGVSMATGKHASPQKPGWSVSNSVWQRRREETRSETHKYRVILDYFAPAFPLPRTSSFCFGLFHLCIILWECWGRRRRPGRRASPWRPLWGTRWWVHLLVCDRLDGWLCTSLKRWLSTQPVQQRLKAAEKC